MTPVFFAGPDLPEPRPALGPLRVLVVDDERDTVLTSVMLLRNHGLVARGAYDGRSALEELDEFNPDAVLLDIEMPGMSGWDVAREVRKRHRSRPVLIAVSGSHVKAPDDVLSRVAGFNHFFVKPYDPQQLVKVLSAIVPSPK